MHKDEVTPERIEQALDRLALTIKAAPDEAARQKVLPLFRRLERDLAALHEEIAATARATRRVRAQGLAKTPFALSSEEIEEGLIIAAQLVDRYGEMLLPYFLRFEELRDERDEIEAALARARNLAHSQNK